MSPSQPRIAPLSADELNEEQAEIVAPMAQDGGTVPNIVLTMMRHMPLFTTFRVFGRHIMSDSSLDPRLREILIMRVGWKTRCEYQWGQHVRMSAPAGLTPEDHERIKRGADAEGWSDLESALITAADELLDTTNISRDTWTRLDEHLSTEELMDTIFTVGQYNMVAMALNSMGIAPEPGLPGFDG